MIPVRTQQPPPQRLPGQQGWPGWPQAWQLRGGGISQRIRRPHAGAGPSAAQIASASSQGGRGEARQQGCPFCPHRAAALRQVPPGPRGDEQRRPWRRRPPSAAAAVRAQDGAGRRRTAGLPGTATSPAHPRRRQARAPGGPSALQARPAPHGARRGSRAFPLAPSGRTQVEVAESQARPMPSQGAAGGAVAAGLALAAASIAAAAFAAALGSAARARGQAAVGAAAAAPVALTAAAGSAPARRRGGSGGCCRCRPCPGPGTPRRGSTPARSRRRWCRCPRRRRCRRRCSCRARSRADRSRRMALPHRIPSGTCPAAAGRRRSPRRRFVPRSSRRPRRRCPSSTPAPARRRRAAGATSPPAAASPTTRGRGRSGRAPSGADGAAGGGGGQSAVEQAAVEQAARRSRPRAPMRIRGTLSETDAAARKCAKTSCACARRRGDAQNVVPFQDGAGSEARAADQGRTNSATFSRFWPSVSRAGSTGRRSALRQNPTYSAYVPAAIVGPNGTLWVSRTTWPGRQRSTG